MTEVNEKYDTDVGRRLYEVSDPLEATCVALGILRWNTKQGRSPLPFVGAALIAVLPFVLVVAVASLVLPREFVIALVLTLLGVVLVKPYDRLVRWAWKRASAARDEARSLTSYLFKLLAFHSVQPRRTFTRITEEGHGSGFLMRWDEDSISQLKWYLDVLRFRFAEWTINRFSTLVVGSVVTQPDGRLVAHNEARSLNAARVRPLNIWRRWCCYRALRCLGLLLRKYHRQLSDPDAPVQTLADYWFGETIYLPPSGTWLRNTINTLALTVFGLGCLSRG